MGFLVSGRLTWIQYLSEALYANTLPRCCQHQVCIRQSLFSVCQEVRRVRSIKEHFHGFGFMNYNISFEASLIFSAAYSYLTSLIFHCSNEIENWFFQAIMDYFEPIREYDISAPCLADLFHFLLTTYNYAQTASIASKCTNCSCTGEYRNKVREIQWIFDGCIHLILSSSNKLRILIIGYPYFVYNPGMVSGWTGSWYSIIQIQTAIRV